MALWLTALCLGLYLPSALAQQGGYSSGYHDGASIPGHAVDPDTEPPPPQPQSKPKTMADLVKDQQAGLRAANDEHLKGLRAAMRLPVAERAAAVRAANDRYQGQVKAVNDSFRQGLAALHPSHNSTGSQSPGQHGTGSSGH